MSTDTQSENGKPANEGATAGRPDRDAASPETPVGESPADPAAEQAQTGPKAYVDPSIAAEARIAELEAEVSDMKDRYLRAHAETENLRKRTEREKSDIAKYAVTSFARDMVAIADNLRRAIDAAGGAREDQQSGALTALLDGVELTDQELQKALEKHGVRPIAAKDELFDPHKHQAVMEQEDKSVPAGTVLQVFQDGYQIEDRVLRPSMVVVAKGGAKPIKSTDAAPNLSQPDNENDSADKPSTSDEAPPSADDAESAREPRPEGNASTS